eukprot:TRINITY_DN1036_c0_g1_i2.p1 TRINITY_DN1036_c0_g1~~TRINITY_DN1036_c0_g1_i2.p1  ORF type:complete len:106 (+),score=22.96 TRINITY_DN1036_c0_g1_i2:698-1015(+)
MIQEKIRGTSTTFWVQPEQTKKTKFDLFQDMWCAPCLRTIKAEPCGEQMIKFIACFEMDYKNQDPETALPIHQICGPEIIAKDDCIMQHQDFYEEVFAKMKNKNK